MKKSIKAALLSGLVFPGVGHFALKQYGRGLVFFVPAMLGLIYIANNIVQRAWSLAGKIMSGAISSDTATIAAMVSAEAGGADSLMLNIAGWVIAGCWIAGIVDAYRIGSMEDKANAKGE